MKQRIRVARLVGVGVVVATFAACSGTKEPSAEADAATTPAASAIPSPSASTTAPPTDAGDSGVLRDVADSEVRDASDAADGADGYDGAPLPGSVETVADIPGLTDFDFVGSHLLYRSGGAQPDFRHCTLPTCADENVIDGAPIVDPRGVSAWSAGSDGRVHYFTPFPPSPVHIVLAYSVLFDGADGRTSGELVYNSGPDPILYGFHGGRTGRAMFLFTTVRPVGPATTSFVEYPHGGANVARVARASEFFHSNEGAEVAYSPSRTPAFSGIDAPSPPTNPDRVAVSAAGPTVPHPTVVVLRDGNVEACPLATPCLAWLNLGALGTILNLDDLHLYIGTPAGLSRCSLAEIGTAGTCTLVPHGPVEAVEEPLYLTTTHAWYRSGTQVRRVLK